MKQDKNKEYLHMFDEILDDDEQIVKVFKPSKTRSIWLSLITDVINLLIFCPTMCYLILFINDFNNIGLIVGVVVGIYLLLITIHQVEKIVRYNHTFYAYTNKRILIRSGFIGVDYSTVDLQTIGAIHVNVGFFDKFVKPNKSGTIIFSSISQIGISICFSNICNPYEVYKEIKEYIDQLKQDLCFDGIKYVNKQSLKETEELNNKEEKK